MAKVKAVMKAEDRAVVTPGASGCFRLFPAVSGFSRRVWGKLGARRGKAEGKPKGAARPLLPRAKEFAFMSGPPAE